jgi:hypothetical protein
MQGEIDTERAARDILARRDFKRECFHSPLSPSPDKPE